MVIPPTLREILGINPGDSVSVAGMGNYVELAVQSAWDNKINEIENNEELREALSRINFSEDE